MSNPTHNLAPCGCTVFRQCAQHWAEKQERWMKTQRRIQELREKRHERDVNEMLNRDGKVEDE